MGMRKFQKIVITFNIDSGKHMEQVKNISHLETMFGKRKFIYIIFFIYIKLITIFYSCDSLRFSTLELIILFGINLKGENFKFSCTRKWWKISIEDWSWRCCMLYIGHLRMEKAKWCFAGLCRQQRVSFNFWWIKKIEVLEAFRQRIITSLLSYP